jgi:hypothetical protein
MRVSKLQGLCAGLLLVGSLYARTAAAADVLISDNARAHFNAGVSLLQDPDGARYEEAYREFQAAYADSPSWKICGNLGITAMKLERDGEAIEAFRTYLKEGGTAIEAEERAQMQRDLDTLTAGVVTLRFSSLPAGAFVIDERIPVQGSPIKNSYGPLTQQLVIGVRPGQHRLTAHLEGYKDEVWMVDARSGSTLEHVFELKQPDVAGSTGQGPGQTHDRVATSRPVPTGVYIGLAATGLLAIGTGVVGVMASAKHSDFESKNDGSDPIAARDLKDSGKTLNVVTDALLGGAIVAGGITAVLYFTRPSKPVDRGSLQVFPVAGPRAAGFSLTGSF